MIRILFLAANPVDQARLRVRAEFNGVRQVLDATAARNRFQLIPEFDATPDELQDLLTRHRPQIVHFSGHGTAAGLLFTDQNGEGELVAPQTLRDLFGSFNESLHCVVLNACSSAEQAGAIAAVVDAVVGMGDVVSDDGAVAFATAFYRALMSDATLATAMARARNQIDLAGLAEVDTPQLRADRIDAEQVRMVDWDDASRGVPVKERMLYSPINEEIWIDLRKILIELYPRGPEDQQIWIRAGGDLSMLSLTSTGKALWVTAIDLVKKGGGGNSINLFSLIDTIDEDFPHSQDFISLKERVGR